MNKAIPQMSRHMEHGLLAYDRRAADAAFWDERLLSRHSNSERMHFARRTIRKDARLH